MATMEDRVSIVEGAIVRIENRFDALEAKVDDNHKTVMAMLDSIVKLVGHSPNY